MMVCVCTMMRESIWAMGEGENETASLNGIQKLVSNCKGKQMEREKQNHEGGML